MTVLKTQIQYLTSNKCTSLGTETHIHVVRLDVASLNSHGWARVPLSSFFLKFPSFFPTFPQTFLILSSLWPCEQVIRPPGKALVTSLLNSMFSPFQKKRQVCPIPCQVELSVPCIISVLSIICSDKVLYTRVNARLFFWYCLHNNNYQQTIAQRDNV